MAHTPLSPGSRIVVVTGASSGIGREICRHLAAADWHVVMLARRVDELEQTLHMIGGRGEVIPCDIADPDQVDAAADHIMHRHGRCDALINNAGVGARISPDNPQAIDRLEHVMRVNFVGAARLTYRLRPLLESTAASADARPGVSIVNISSVAGLMGLPGASIYCASKFALTGWSEALHAELAPRGIRVSCIHPGPAPTEGWPHTELQGRWYRPLAATTATKVAHRVVREVTTCRGNPAPVMPVGYRAGVLLRACAPWLLRRIVCRAALRQSRSAQDAAT